MVRWSLHARSSLLNVVEVSGAYPGKTAPPGNDLLLLRVKQFTQLPSYPLHVRRTPLAPGETVHLIGCPYSDSDGKQKVYSGKVTTVEKDGYFAYQIHPAVNLVGFSGAPIIDTNGHVVGICTVWFQRQIYDGKDLVGGGDSTLPRIQISERTNDRIE